MIRLVIEAATIEAAKISATGEEILSSNQKQMIEQVKFTK